MWILLQLQIYTKVVIKSNKTGDYLPFRRLIRKFAYDYAFQLPDIPDIRAGCIRPLLGGAHLKMVEYGAAGCQLLFLRLVEPPVSGTDACHMPAQLGRSGSDVLKKRQALAAVMAHGYFGTQFRSSRNFQIFQFLRIQPVGVALLHRI